MHVWALGLSCEAPAAFGPGASNTTKIPRKDLQDRKKDRKLWRGEGKNNAKFWAPTLFLGLGCYNSGPPPFGCPFFLGLWAPFGERAQRGCPRLSLVEGWLDQKTKTPMTLAKVGLAKVGQLRLAKVGQFFFAKVGLAKVGLTKVG